MITVDARGKLCPQPLIMTKRALKSAAQGEEMLLLVDNRIAYTNLQDYLKELGFLFQCRWADDQGELVFKNQVSSDAVESVDEVAFCQPVTLTPIGKHVLVLKSELMGAGDDALGVMLMRAFLNSLPDADLLPRHVIMYNGGVKLALQGRDTVEALEKLAKLGVSIYLCGACVDFFEVKEHIAVGQITNMFKITEMVSQASHVIYP